MSGGKKKSGFQITSVTSDYQHKEASLGGEAKGPAGPPASRGLAATEEADAGEGDSPRASEGPVPPNGPSAPSSPGAPPSFQGPGVVAGSRFRVVKLDQGSGEPYKRGRWTCRDFYDQEVDQHLVGRFVDSARHPQSLDSRLEVAGLLAKPVSPYSPQPPRRGPYLPSQLVLPTPGPSGHQARSLGGGLPVLVHPNRTPSSPVSLHSSLAVVETRPPAPGDSTKESGDQTPPGTLPALVVEEHLLPKNVSQLIQRETEERCKVLPRESRSRPSSPAPPLFRDASPSRRTSDPFGVARFSLARSMFGMGVAHDSDDDSGTSSSMIAIDNKIEQAMDLVKSHLMFAVREEVEVLREQIKELSERNALLEQENALLRSLASPEQLARFQAQRHAAKPPPSGTA
ncbi:sperm acrosome developmental regulator isoform X2 [Eublepharis macularius]|uniref:Sperm acrosome developmental regulator isoform X2 n=1 Tax=Eublepharis macularius TaxID=481883 RepID=A0AA97K6S2_EUBMA|nr:sperm acrosome developmental regulator isoform X2 [Eublepharis macularius]